MIKEKETLAKDKAENEFGENELLNGLRRIRIANIWTVRIFFTVFFAVAVVALIIPLRPTYSDTEKRELSKFPEFSVASLFSGEYFKGMDNWYSDTFPARDSFTDINTRITMLFGKTDVQIHGEVEEGDAIPSVEEVTSNDKENNVTSSEKTEVSSNADTSSEESSQPTSSAPVSSEAPPQPPPPTTQTLGALLINGDSAYEYYNFSREAADIYTDAVNRAGILLNGKAQVYDLIIPTSMSITAPDDLVATVNTSDQQAAINYMHSRLAAPVKYVPLYDMLKSRRNEYVYFRTDHHWTALGAYYTYCELMRAKGTEPLPLDSYVKHEFGGFLGTFYSSSGKLPQLAANPDTVYAYQPPMTNTLSLFDKAGYWYNTTIISDMSASSPSNKYLTFIKGDNALSKIDNPNLADGSACIVIKESFGNAFAPFLVPHYQTVYIVDYRHIGLLDARGLAQLQADSGAKDIIFINNISATRNKTLMGYINNYVR
ncbi:MAG: hypothetical protein J6J30_05310 [Clostridia bacterium]|nr:hypothetical protein [Clostridia bacterium]